MTLPEIDESRIQEIISRARDLYSQGLMDRTEWLQLNRDFAAASHGRLEMPGILSRSGKHEWFEELRNLSPERVA